MASELLESKVITYYDEDESGSDSEDDSKDKSSDDSEDDSKEDDDDELMGEDDYGFGDQEEEDPM